MYCAIKHKRILVSSVVLASVVFVSGCGGGSTIGLGIPSDQSEVSLAEVLNSPSKYHEKTFVVKGSVSSQCAALCDFVLSDGVNSITIFSQNFKFPKLPIGKQVTVYVQATVGEERVILSALGMKVG